MRRIAVLLMFVVGCGFSAEIHDPKSDPTVDARTSSVDPPSDAGPTGPIAGDASVTTPDAAPCRRGEEDCKGGPKPPGP